MSFGHNLIFYTQSCVSSLFTPNWYYNNSLYWLSSQPIYTWCTVDMTVQRPYNKLNVGTEFVNVFDELTECQLPLQPWDFSVTSVLYVDNMRVGILYFATGCCVAAWYGELNRYTEIYGPIPASVEKSLPRRSSSVLYTTMTTDPTTDNRVCDSVCTQISWFSLSFLNILLYQH